MFSFGTGKSYGADCWLKRHKLAVVRIAYIRFVSFTFARICTFNIVSMNWCCHHNELAFIVSLFEPDVGVCSSVCFYRRSLQSQVHNYVLFQTIKVPFAVPRCLAASEDKQGTRIEPLQACGEVCSHNLCTVISPVLRSTDYRVYTSSANTIGRPLSLLFHSCEVRYSSPSCTVLLFVVFCHWNSRSFTVFEPLLQ